VDSPSPHAPATLAADKRAFSALMRHLREADALRTVIMVQVENEPGTWGAVRDYSPAAQKLFEGPVPAELLKALQSFAGRDRRCSTSATTNPPALATSSRNSARDSSTSSPVEP